MATILKSRFDITPDAVLRVAWRGEPVAVAPEALARIAERRQSFLDFLARAPGAGVYGVNVGQGETIHHEMTDAEIERLARLKPLAAAVSFGTPFPDRVVRAIVLARFANILDGHAMASPRIAEALVDMLNDGPLPKVPRSGQGGPGEILALYPLFAAISQSIDLAPGERGALINGSPAGAALLADGALSARRRLEIAEAVLTLAIAAFNAPREHYDAVLADLMGGTHNKAALDRLNALLGPDDGAAGRAHQAPVSYRIIPSVLGHAHWAVEQAEGVAATALSAVTHNPVYLPPDDDHPSGRCISTGGFHNAMTAPLLDGLAAAWADLCLLCERLCSGLLSGRVSGYPDFLLTDRAQGDSDGHGAVGYLPMAIVGYVEEARQAAQRTFIPAADASVFGQDNVASPVFLAWPKQEKAGRCLDASLAVLAATASQALHVTQRHGLSPPLDDLLNRVRARVPPVDADRVLGPELAVLADDLTSAVFAAGDAA